LVSIYHNSMHLGLTMTRCQKESLFNDPKITDMILAFTNGMDHNVEPSLPSMGILSNTSENMNFLNDVLNQRQPKSTSWINVNNLLAAVSWKG
jgi:hypothetical protein